MDPKELHRKHYDSQAVLARSRVGHIKIGPERVNLAIREPYEFAMNWLEHRCQKKIVLDYGCGGGEDSVFLAKKGALVIGIDISPQSIQNANTLAVREGVQERASFEVGDCEKLRFDDNYFDFIFSNGTLSCLNLKVAYSEMARVLKPDGYVIIVDTLRHNPLANLSRWMRLKQGLTTQWIFDHILSWEDLYIARNYFGKLEIHYFNLLATLAIAPFVVDTGVFYRAMTCVAKQVDRFLLRIPLLQKYAFKVVIILAEPRKCTLDAAGSVSLKTGR